MKARFQEVFNIIFDIRRNSTTPAIVLSKLRILEITLHEILLDIDITILEERLKSIKNDLESAIEKLEKEK